MNNKFTFPILVAVFAAVVALVVYLGQGHTIAILDTKGLIATRERDLLYFAWGLMLLVCIPVYLLTAGIAWHYRADNKKAKYLPNWEHNTRDELIWWAVPSVIIFILAVSTWNSTQELDPFKPLVSAKPQLTIQVVALNWKWLFIYPQQGIATMNYIEIPIGTPVRFDITSQGPMNSFWIPQLGGQVYAMSGMSTRLHLVASEAGEYAGSSANFSGEGFADMKFVAKAVSQTEFDAWVATMRAASSTLSYSEYAELAQPSSKYPHTSYASVEKNLYTRIRMQFMSPTAKSDTIPHRDHRLVPASSSAATSTSATATPAEQAQTGQAALIDGIQM